ncbi:hypothetical protein KPH14_007918 [Odynerus spinipes]|uniref:Uncharacterized protein n=1 Tax=Odynerus spinipes TaxID=1348599 RepID=A0AAD9RJV9_9HYME|nr:hypothetical protein KPH14_007918 [Odynerus spinipes]
MADHLDRAFQEIVRDIELKLKTCGKEDQRAVLDMLEETSKDICNDEDKRRRNDRGRYLLYMIDSGERPSDKFNKSEGDNCCGKCHSIGPSTSKIPSSKKSLLERLEPKTDMIGIRDVINRVRCDEITTTAEFIFNIMYYVKDSGVTLQEIFEKNLQLFREVVEDTIDRRIQDECDVMMHTQNDIKLKFRTLTEGMERRIKKIKRRLFEISPDFDWLTDGKDKRKLSKLIVKRYPETKEQPDETEKLIHQAFMRGQWLNKELSRLQEENANLKTYLDKFRCLAEERKAQESHVPRILQKEKKHLEQELNKQRKIYKQNLEMIDDLYIDYQTYNSENNNTEKSFH